MRSRILFLPELSEPSELTDLLARAAFHLAHAEPEALTFVAEKGVGGAATEAIQQAIVPEWFDPAIGEQIRRILDRVSIVEADTPEGERIGDLSDIVGVWNSDRFKSGAWVLEAGRRTPGHSIFDVDEKANPSATAEFGALAATLTPSPPTAEQNRFTRMVKAIGGTYHVLLYAGPVGSEFKSFSDGISIVCGAAIVDAARLEEVEPQVAVLTDPARHFGPTHHATHIRTELRRAMARDPALWALVPIEFRAFLVDRMPEHQGRIVGVPYLEADEPLTLDLRVRFGVTRLPTALDVIIPLAATIGQHISIIGYDSGVGPDTDDAEDLRRAHPALVDGSEAGHSEAESAAVELLVEACEAAGIRVESYGASNILPLRRRSGVPEAGPISIPREFATHGGTAVVWVDPDWINDYGHYGHWYRALAAEAEGEGVPTIALAARGVQAPGREDVHGTFTYPTVNPDAANMYAPSFEAELTSAVARLLDAAPDVSLVLAIFTADAWHLPPLIRVASKFAGRVRIAANLMRAHRKILQVARAPAGEMDWWAQSFRRLVELGRSVGLTVALDSDDLARVVSDTIHIELPVWPLTTPPGRSVDSPASPHKEIVFFSPGQPQFAKGAIEFADAAVSMLSGPWNEQATFRMRFVEQPTGTHERVLRAIERAADAGVEIVRGVLSYEEHSAAFADADVIVIPYRMDPFRTRTNAVVVDAMRAGKPVVVAAGTWAASLAAPMGTSVEFRSGDAADLARAMAESANRLPALSERARRHAADVNDRFSMSTLLESILKVDPARAGHDPETTAAAATGVEAVFAAYHAGRAEKQHLGQNWATELGEALNEAEQEGQHLRDRIEELERALSDRDRRYERLELAAVKARTRTSALAEELAEANSTLGETTRQAADLEQLVDELQDKRNSRFVARLKRRFGAAPGSTRGDGVE